MDFLEQNMFKLFLASQVADSDKIHEAFTALTQNASADEDVTLDQCIDRINNTIKNYNLEIVQCASEISGRISYALIAARKINVSEYSKFYDKKTLLYFSKILRGCVLSAMGCITEIDCLNLSMESDLSKINAQETLNGLVKLYWLDRKDGKIYLGPRAIAEFGQMLSTDFSANIKKCPLCRNIIVYGENCESCQCKIHSHCIQKYVRINPVCPECKASWNQVTSAYEDDSNTTAETGSSRPKRPRVISDD